jgi:hypothetical protein
MTDKQDKKSDVNRENDTNSIMTTTIADHIQDRHYDNTNTCVVYKFKSRPPYEGFILILVIVLITVLFIWWLNGKFSPSE